MFAKKEEFLEFMRNNWIIEDEGIKLAISDVSKFDDKEKEYLEAFIDINTKTTNFILKTTFPGGVLYWEYDGLPGMYSDLAILLENDETPVDVVEDCRKTIENKRKEITEGIMNSDYIIKKDNLKDEFYKLLEETREFLKIIKAHNQKSKKATVAKR